MRRTDREISDRAEIDAIIRGCQVCHLACTRNNEPYVVPLSFGYDGEAVYFHTATAGQKIDYLTANGRVCLGFERNVELVVSDSEACRFTFSYESVIAHGEAVELLNAKQKEGGLNQIMLQYSDREWSFDPAVLGRTRVWRVPIDRVTGKRSEQKAF
jgi:nitroimidazol reductase NimA-like FMN-containing flavoprotein (pyridoxamine 5'-phosphate oxidase superfamily)